MQYSQALEEQLKWLRWTQQTATKGRVAIAKAGRMEFAERALLEGETYYWAPSITKVIAETVQTLPPTWRFHPEMLPTQRGFFWFDGGLLLRLPTDTSVLYRVEAIAWGSGISAEDDSPSAHMIAFTNQSDEPQWTKLSSAVLKQSVTLHDTCERMIGDCSSAKEDPAAGTIALSAFAACLSFLQQRIFISPRHQAERHVRRRMERQGYQHEPVVRIVELRRQHIRSEQSGEHESVEWSCQWIVSGHWRNQWYPSLNDYQPRWIMPYVKGPEDAPLKPPRAKVFAVIR